MQVHATKRGGFDFGGMPPVTAWVLPKNMGISGWWYVPRVTLHFTRATVWVLPKNMGISGWWCVPRVALHFTRATV